MNLVIRCEKPLCLQHLLPLWQRVHHSRVTGEPVPERWKHLLAQAESFPGADNEWGDELAALRELVRMDAGFPLYIQELVVPKSLPVHLLPLLAGWKIRECRESKLSDYSPIALLWLKERGVQQIGELNGRIERVECGDGVALLQMAGTEGVSVVRERRVHDVEHVDEGMVLLQANLDDSNPEWLGYVMEQLFRSGANDVSFLPMTMKKSRPGVMLQVLIYQSQLEAVKSILFRETTTFGLRYFPVACHRLARRFVTVGTQWGEVPVKLGYHQGERVQTAPEHAVCARLAEAAGVPLKHVYQQALKLAQESSPAKI